MSEPENMVIDDWILDKPTLAHPLKNNHIDFVETKDSTNNSTTTSIGCDKSSLLVYKILTSGLQKT